MAELIRTFDTGATRDLDQGKLDFEGFLSPLVVDAYARYMHSKRKMADGSLRDSDNWQKGIPLDAYAKSGFRHQIDWWKHHRGLSDLAVEDLEDTLCALLFNVQGYLHEVLKARRSPATPTADSPPWIVWGGGTRPVDGSTKVEVRLRDGRELTARAEDIGWGAVRAAGAYDVVAYRVVD